MNLAEKQGKRAEVAVWKGHALIYPLSGRGLLRDDPEAFYCTLPEDSTEDTLGNALHSALGASRFLNADDAKEFLRYDKVAWEQRVARCASTVGAISSRAFLATLRKCFVTEQGGLIVLTPTRRIRGPAWEAIEDLSPVEVSIDAPPLELGIALRQVLSSCTT